MYLRGYISNGTVLVHRARHTYDSDTSATTGNDIYARNIESTERRDLTIVFTILSNPRRYVRSYDWSWLTTGKNHSAVLIDYLTKQITAERLKHWIKTMRNVGAYVQIDRNMLL